MLCHLRTPAIKKSDNPPCQIQLLKKIADKLSDKKEESLKAAIGALAQEKYKQPAKPLQIEAVYNLACGRNTFLLAGACLLTRNNKSILLMSATSPPIAIEGIKKSLKLEPHNLTIVQGELTRPKIQIICVHITESMALCGHLLLVFPSKANVSDDSIFPTLIYSGYIPLSMDNPNYKREQECKKNAGFAACMCSNCTPAEGLMSRIKTMDIHNMEEMILRYWPAPAPLVTTTKRKRATGGNGGTSATRKEKKTQLAASKNLV
ncbi:hypothetical protein MJO28_015141 [Puccinia striiformis f. sp. tritici]|uniref:Uncharacterized protein n=1 Tax=Puccinia striiformis f. sp. tritici TaxID=168172 RepID=A0ACC0DSC7_9BASI|nr:hypothetical protein MJO28_015141 [Puccinia striiformis f. sp. tritici]